jgi:hypothetical protein
MIHWSHIKGPLTEGFRKQREKHAASAVEPPIPQPLRSSQTDYGKDEMEAHMPAHFTAVEPLQNMASYGDTAMTPYELEQRSGMPARQQTTVPFRRLVLPHTHIWLWVIKITTTRLMLMGTMIGKDREPPTI